MAPTSSILPIKDPIAERRMYFSMLGLLLIVVDLLAPREDGPRGAGGRLRGGRARWPRSRRTRAPRSGRDPVPAVGGHGPQVARTSRGRISNWPRRTTSRRRYDLRASPSSRQAAQLRTPDYNLLVELGPGLRRLNQPMRRSRSCGRPPPSSRRRTSTRRSA